MHGRFGGTHLRQSRIFLPTAVGVLCLPLAIAVYFTNASGSSPLAHSPPVAVSAADTNLLVSAEQVLIRDCMRRHGFAYWPLTASQAYPTARFPYVITSVPWARRHGFSGALVAVTSQNPNQYYYGRLTTAQQAAYSNALVGNADSPGVTTSLPTGGIEGHSADGCQVTADAELYGNYQYWFKASTVALDLPILTQSMVFSDRRYNHAVSVWSACMQAKGYRYSNPAQAPAGTRSQQIRAAVAEAQCAGSTGLTTVAGNLSHEYAARVSQEFRSALEAEWRLEQRALPWARQVLRS
ncbi:MAG TPA: hypothetical protein VGH27_29735 [Streptosporangiaceae bacterium]|jgi:hypothetical protein